MVGEIVGAVVGGAGIVTIFEFLRDRKAKKKAAKERANQEAENTKQEQCDTASKQLELMGKMMELVETYGDKVKQYSTDTAGSYEEIKLQLTDIQNDVIEIKREQADQKEFLNGDYAAFLKKKYRNK